MTNAPVPAGWYPDPAGGPNSRWWDGTAWTENTQAPYSTAAAALTAPAGTKVYSVWIWFVVFLPYMSFPFLFTMDFSSLFDMSALNDEQAALDAQLALMTSPALILSSVVGWLAIAASVFAAYRDWRWLQQQGVPKPFHWAFNFIILAGYPVYAIGRAVVTKRRTGHGSAVLWTTIAMFVLSFVVGIGWAISLVAGMMQQMTPYLGY